MKANEAPEKIYIFDNPILDFTKLNIKQGDDDIEYTRTDAFIERVCEWLNKNFNMPDDFKEHLKKAMKGE